MAQSAWPSMPVQSVVEHIIRGEQDGQTTMTVLHWRVACDNAPDMLIKVNEALQALDEAARGVDGIHSAITDSRSADWKNTYSQWQVLVPERLPYIRFHDAAPGGVAGASLPSNSSVVLVKRGPAAGRHNRGAIHLPGVPVAHTEDSRLNAAGMGAMAALSAIVPEWLQVMVGGRILEAYPIIYDREAAILSADIIDCTPVPEIRTMRRRTVGRGI